MQYRLVVSKSAQKELNKIDSRYHLRILATLEAIASDPFSGKRLEGEHKGEWSVRVWPYRVIYRIHKYELIVLVVTISHRQGVYK